MDIRLKRYKKEFDHSFSFGVYPTLELLQHQPKETLGVIIHPQGLENRGVAKIKEICQNQGIPFEVQEKAFSRIGARENDYAAGIFRKTQKHLDKAANHVILVHPAGTGNLGTIIRTMLGFGFQDLAIIEPGADLFHPETVRASMGALFQLRAARFLTFDDYRKRFSRKIYTLMTDGSVPLSEAKFEPPFGLVFGNESAGLPEEYHAYGQSIRIPQTKAIDSLNLAVSVGITLYESNKRSMAGEY